MAARVGLIVNPIAGLGGSVGLKGTDGRAVVERARALGAIPRAPGRAAAALEEMARARADVELLTCAGPMGEDSAREAGTAATIVYRARSAATTAGDTRAAAREMAHRKVDLLLFAGGDGTARDVAEAIGETVPVIGIPAGVKIHSAAFAINPRAAGDLAARYVGSGGGDLREAEVMDVDEAAYRRGRLSAKLVGYLRMPFDASLVQATKARSSSDAAALEELARAVTRALEPGTLYVVGPGTTTRRILASMGLDSTLLGVDVVLDKQVVARDVDESALLRLIGEHPAARIIVTPIGGQGYLFGRGNQQISARVLRAVGIANVVVVATPAKLASLGGRPFLVDTEDESLNRAFGGSIGVLTGVGRRAVYPVGP
ncbi:MAG TPA: ATP-NAD kinase family protein [Candidatus Limnocylindrales bacterium]|nr:ATP-NAD kinase family protein [Candidatus Limnocylindrales bacterium]